MNQIEIFNGILHETPSDLNTALANNFEVLSKWNALTPIQRNEWICWITIVKKQETRKKHIERAISQILEGKKQPCCWPGCPHRKTNTDKEINNKEFKKWK